MLSRKSIYIFIFSLIYFHHYIVHLSALICCSGPALVIKSYFCIISIRINSLIMTIATLKKYSKLSFIHYFYADDNHITYIVTFTKKYITAGDNWKMTIAQHSELHLVSSEIKPFILQFFLLIQTSPHSSHV